MNRIKEAILDAVSKEVRELSSISDVGAFKISLIELIEHDIDVKNAMERRINEILERALK